MELGAFTNTVLELNKLMYPEEMGYWESKKIHYFRREELDTLVTSEEIEIMVQRVKAIATYVQNFKIYLDDLSTLQKKQDTSISEIPTLVLKNAAPRSLLLRWSKSINTAMIKGEHYQKFGVVLPPTIRKQYFQLKECIDTSIIIEAVIQRSIEKTLCSSDLIEYLSAVDCLRERFSEEGSFKLTQLYKKFRVPTFPPPAIDNIFMKKKGITQNYGKMNTIRESVSSMDFTPFDEEIAKNYNYSYDYYVEEVQGNKNYVIKYGGVHNYLVYLERFCDLLKFLEVSGGVLRFEDLSQGEKPSLLTLSVPDFKKQLRSDSFVGELLGLYESSESIIIKGIGLLSPYKIIPASAEEEGLLQGYITSPFFPKQLIYLTEKNQATHFKIHTLFQWERS